MKRAEVMPHGEAVVDANVRAVEDLNRRSRAGGQAA